jgi:hypothetical protein
MSQNRTIRIATLVAMSALAGVAFGQSAQDHLTCFKVKDSAPKAKYHATLTTAAGSQSCTVKAPAKMACVQTAKSGVSPTPPGGGPGGSPAGSFLCYQAKCPKPSSAGTNAVDQFGQRLVKFGGAKLLCAPAIVAAPTPGAPTTTTTTLPGQPGSCSFTDGKCQGTCGAGSKCGAAVGTGSCECRSVACGDADAPTCDGACSEAGKACIFSFTGCSCVRIP